MLVTVEFDAGYDPRLQDKMVGSGSGTRGSKGPAPCGRVGRRRPIVQHAQAGRSRRDRRYCYPLTISDFASRHCSYSQT